MEHAHVKEIDNNCFYYSLFLNRRWGVLELTPQLPTFYEKIFLNNKQDKQPFQDRMYNPRKCWFFYCYF